MTCEFAIVMCPITSYLLPFLRCFHTHCINRWHTGLFRGSVGMDALVNFGNSLKPTHCARGLNCSKVNSCIHSSLINSGLCVICIPHTTRAERRNPWLAHAHFTFCHNKCATEVHNQTWRFNMSNPHEWTHKSIAQLENLRTWWRHACITIAVVESCGQESCSVHGLKFCHNTLHDLNTNFCILYADKASVCLSWLISIYTS